MNKDYNNLLIWGICAIVIGVFLLCYSLRAYSEIKYLNNKIDFDELDNNNRISTSDKYYKYLSIGDFLTHKLEKNKNLPVKNISCAYLDYQQHNISSLYRLIYKSANDDQSRRSVVEGNIRAYLIMMDNYKTCRKYSQYKDEIQKKIEEIEKTDNLLLESRMDAFLNSGRVIPADVETDSEGVGMQPVSDEANNNVVEPESSSARTLEQNSQPDNTDNLVRPYLQ